LNSRTLSEYASEGTAPDILFWVGCAGSFDERAQKVTRAVARILDHCGIRYAVLGTEESCTGDPARRAGNEFLFQMQALTNIQVMNGYGIRRIVTACPHCFNTLRNEYPALGGTYEVLHHSMLLQQLINEGRLTVQGGKFIGRKIVYHDACYLGRANGVYEAPRDLIRALDGELQEMRRSRANGLCCGAGGGQMFKEPEAGNKDINVERAGEALSHDPAIVAVACPFCMTMMTDGVKHFEREDTVKVADLAELIAEANGL